LRKWIIGEKINIRLELTPKDRICDFQWFYPPQPPKGGAIINQQLAKSPPWGI